MTQNSTGANGTSKSVAEIRSWYENNFDKIKKYEAAKNVLTLRDISQSAEYEKINTIDKRELKELISNIGSSEKRLRKTARYLFYRSNVFFRIVMWYATMFDLNCRQVVPKYSLVKDNDQSKMLKSFNDTLDVLDKINLQGNTIDALINVFVQDVYYAIAFYDEDGMFLYPLDPDDCIIDTHYQAGGFGFAVDMSKYRSVKKQKIIEKLGSPLKEMYQEYLNTKERYIHMPDEYAFCLKFRTDTWNMVAPPILPIFLQIAGLEDLVDIQSEADELSIYKLIYMPMKVISGSKESDNFQVTPDISLEYLGRMISKGLVPENVSLAAIPGDELKVIDFDKNVDSDTTSVEKSSNQILQTAGGGAVINASNITSTAAFNAWLKSETEFATSTLLPQLDGFVNRMLGYKLGNNACKVKHFEVSVYTKSDLAEKLLSSNQYSYSNRLAYNTCLGISEKDTLAMIYFETEVLKLQDKMRFPLMSSYTSSNSDNGYTEEVGQGRPKVDDDKLTTSGDEGRNR